MAKIVPASLWTRKDLREFKDSLRTCKENVVRIGSLATATVRGYMPVFCPSRAFLALYFMYSLSSEHAEFVVRHIFMLLLAAPSDILIVACFMPA